MSTPENEPQLTRIDYIDVWRFIAVMLVIQSHLFLFSGLPVPALDPYSLQLDRLGEFGVLIFFVISGFVICSGLISEKTNTGSVSLSAFFVRRFFRIIPALWLYLAAIGVLDYFDIVHITGKQALTSLLFLCNMPFPDGCSWYAGHTWSLAYEEQFYLLFPLLFLFVPYISKAKQFAWTIAGLTLASLLFRVNELIFLADYCSYFLFLLTGCWAAIMRPKLMPRLRNVSLLNWLAIVLVLLSCIYWLPVTAEKYVKTIAYPGLIVMLVLGTPTHRPMLAAIFKNRSLCYLGRISYSVYLWQELVTGIYLGWWTAVSIVSVFGFAMLSFNYFETPLQKLGGRLSDKLKQAAKMQMVRL
ncbi:MAG: acyltransferase [Methylococcales bacterium]